MCEGIDTFWVFFIYVPELPKWLCSRWISPEDCPHFILPFPVLFLHSLKGSTYKSVAQGYGITRFIMLHFIALHKHCVFTNWRFVAVLHWAILSALFFPQHSLTWCLCVTFQYFSKYFKLFHYYYICYGDLWSVIFDVSIAKRSWLPEASVDWISFCICLAQCLAKGSRKCSSSEHLPSGWHTAP